MESTLDSIDKRILLLLTKNSKISIGQIAEHVHLSTTPIARRIKRLEDLGFITGYFAKTCPKKLGYALTAFVGVSMDKHTAERFADFEDTIKNFDEVAQVSLVTGRNEDYLLKVLVRDMAHYEYFLLHQLSKIDGVSHIHTSFELRQVLSRQVL